MPRGKAAKTLAPIYAATGVPGAIRPAGVRAIRYKLFVGGHIADMSKGSTNRVSRALVYARERVPSPSVDEGDLEVLPSRAGEAGDLIAAGRRGA